MGDGFDADTQMGPLVSDEQLEKVGGFLDSGRQEGATVVTGGARQGDRGFFFQPTVISTTRPDMRVVREEIFGPVVVASPFESMDEIAATANDSPYGLGAGIWTKGIQGPRPGQADPRRDGVDPLLQRLRRRPALRRLQAVGMGSGDGATRPSRPTRS